MRYYISTDDIDEFALQMLQEFDAKESWNRLFPAEDLDIGESKEEKRNPRNKQRRAKTFSSL